MEINIGQAKSVSGTLMLLIMNIILLRIELFKLFASKKLNDTIFEESIEFKTLFLKLVRAPILNLDLN